MNRDTLLPIGLVLAACLVVGGFIAFKSYNDKKTPVVVTATKAPAKKDVQEQPPAKEVVQPQPPAEEQKPKSPPKPVVIEEKDDRPDWRGGGELPTEEEAIEMAHEVLNRYRNASPEEKQQIVMGVAMMQGIISGLSQNAGVFLQQMPPEERERIADMAAASQYLLDAVQDEMSYENISPEEAQVFGGLFQSFRNAGEAFSNPQPNFPQQQF